MRKLLFGLSVFACSVSAFADVAPLDVKTCTAEDAWAVAEAVLACTNVTDARQVCKATHLWGIGSRDDLAEVRSRIDTALAEKGVPSTLYGNIRWPKTSALEWARLGVETAAPHCVALCRKYQCEYSPWGLGYSQATIGELATVITDFLSATVSGKSTGYGGIDSYSSLRKAMQRRGEKVIKKWLRRQGRSFVTKDGVNPCAVYAERLTAALNAPRFAGLNEWLEEMGFEERVDVSALPSDAEIQKLRDDVLDAEVSLTERNKTILHLCLGVDGYNAFVREYNGD